MICKSPQGFEFPGLNSMLLWTFSQQGKKSKEIPISFYIFEILIIVKLPHVNILVFIIFEYFEDWFCRSCSQIAENVNMYFFLLTNYLNFDVFDEALALLGLAKKSNNRTIYSFKMLYFKFIHIATSAGINKAITHENNDLTCMYFVLLFLPWHWWI